MPTNDGNVPYGSYLVTVAGSALVAENINPSRPSTIIERRDELNEPSGQVIIPDFETATMTLQRPTTSADVPSVGAAVTFPVGAGMGPTTTTWFISEAGAALDQGDVQKFNVTVRKSVA